LAVLQTDVRVLSKAHVGPCRFSVMHGVKVVHT
jgi:hypothetical protein